MKYYTFGCRLINYMRYLTYTYLAIDMKYFAALFVLILFLKGIPAVITITFIAAAVAGFSEWVQGQRVSIILTSYSL